MGDYYKHDDLMEDVNFDDNELEEDLMQDLKTYGKFGGFK